MCTQRTDWLLSLLSNSEGGWGNEIERESERERNRERERERQWQRQRYKETERDIERDTYKERERERQTERDRDCKGDGGMKTECKFSSLRPVRWCLVWCLFGIWQTIFFFWFLQKMPLHRNPRKLKKMSPFLHQQQKHPEEDKLGNTFRFDRKKDIPKTVLNLLFFLLFFW